MKKNKAITITVIFIAVILASLVAFMAATGRFSALKNHFSDESATSQTQTESTTAVPAVARPKTQKPDQPVAILMENVTEDTANTVSKLDSYGFNTAIIDFTQSNSYAVSVLMNAAKTAGIYTGVRADASSGGNDLLAFLRDNNADFVILSNLDETISDYPTKISELYDKIKAVDPATETGIEPVYCSNISSELKAVIESGKSDFVFVVQQSNNSSGSELFKNAQTAWNETASPVWMCHCVKGLKAFTTQKASDTVSSISRSADMSLCRALAFYPFEDIESASGAAAEIVLNYIKKRDTYLLDKEFSVSNYSKTTFTVEQSTVTFRGTSSPAYDLTCNGKKLNVAKTGDFSVDCNLKVGKNTIKFEHKGKSYTYNVTYKIKLLKSVAPSEDISVPGGMLVQVSAVAHKSASVSVEFNGKTYTMKAIQSEREDDSSPDRDSDFTTFAAELTTPNGTSSVQKLGKYTVTAKYQGLSESKTGASVSVSANEIQPPVIPETSSAATTERTSEQTTVSVDSSQSSSTSQTASSASSAQGDLLEKYSYKSNYGLGTAKICEITDDYVEVYPGNTTATYSVPDCSPLLKGTSDYIKGSATYDGDTYYILASGIKVPLLRSERLASGIEGNITHLKVVDGYIMPKNNIKVVSAKAYAEKTVIELDMNRNVVFNIKLTGQTYGSYNGRNVTVSSLNCTGVEITFSDTVSADGNMAFVNSVIKGGKWSVDKSAAEATLSLELAQKGKFYGFHCEYSENGNLVISFKHKPSSSLSGYTIMLDPGHGGIDGGAGCAVSSTDFGQEKNINLSVALKVKSLLEAEGAKVLMTRSTDKWVSYTQRNDAVRSKEPDMFISMHCDSSTTASAMGTSAYYYRAYSQPLAKALHESIVSAYKTKIYADKPEEFKSKISRGASFYAFRVTRIEECPAVLIEYGFVSNTDECQILQNAANRDILAEATAEGIKKYISAS